MFDDPRRELNRLQQELLVEEEEEEYEEVSEEDDLADILEMLHRDNPRQPAYREDAEAVEEEEDWQEDWEEDYEDETQDSRTLYRERPRRKKGIRGLVILACLELLGIMLILGWWLLWLI